MGNGRGQFRRLLAGLGLGALAPLLLGFLCLPLVAPPPSGVVTPTPAALFAPTLSARVPNPTPGVVSNIEARLSFPAGSTLAIGAVFDLPAGWTVASDVGVTDGSVAGEIVGFMTVENPWPDPFTPFGCNTTVDFASTEVPPTNIALLEATTTTSPTVPGTDSNLNGKPDVIDDVNPANSLPDGVDKYPAFLNTLLPGTHRARYFGHTLAGGISDLYVNILVDELAPGGPYRVITITNDPTAPPESTTNRFCAPQSFTVTLFGTSQDNPATLATEGGQTLYRNPAAAGSYTFGAALVSEFDKDNDGVSNGLDNCPSAANAGQADTDQDFVGDACEADAVQDFDVDGDSLENSYDNCIFVANSATAGPDDQADADYDDIGDACDANASVPDGPNYYLSCTDPVGIGQADPGGASCVQGTPTPRPTPTPTKDPGGDTDGDTVANGSDPDDDNDGCADTRELQTAAGSQVTGGRRNPHSFWDFFDTPNASNVRDRAVTVTDVFGVAGRFGATGAPGDPLAGPIPAAPAYHAAFDRGGQQGANIWNQAPADGAIAIADVFAVAAQFGHSCL